MLNYHKSLYEHYEGSIVVLYWTLTIMNSCMSIMKDASLYYTKGYLSWMFVWVLRMIYYCAIHSAKLLWIFVWMVGWVIWRVYYCIIQNAKLLQNVCLSITKDLLLCILSVKLVRNEWLTLTNGILSGWPEWIND